MESDIGGGRTKEPETESGSENRSGSVQDGGRPRAERDDEMRRRIGTSRRSPSSEFKNGGRRPVTERDTEDNQVRPTARSAISRGPRGDDKSEREQTQERGFPPVMSFKFSSDVSRPMRRRHVDAPRPAYRRSASRCASS
jgi:hypothetical protein